MISKKMQRLQVAFENLTGDSVEEQVVIVETTPATVDVLDYVDQNDNQDQMNKAIALRTFAMNELTTIIEATNTLIDVVESNNTKIEEGNVRAQDVIVANEALAQACALFGIAKPTTFSFESTRQDPVGMLKAANEDIGDTISKGFSAVIKFFKDLFAGIWKFIKGLFVKEEAKVEEIKKTTEVIAKNQPALDEATKRKPIEEVLKDIITDAQNNATLAAKVEKIEKASLNIASAAKLLALITDSKLDSPDSIIKYLSSLDIKIKELMNVDTTEHVAMIEYNAKSIFLCLKASDSDTVEHTLEKINNTSSGVKPASTGITRDLDTIYKGVDKKHFEEVFKYCKELETDDKNSTYSINQNFTTSKGENGTIIASETFSVLVNNYKIVNSRIKAHSELFTVETDIVKSEIKYTKEDFGKVGISNSLDVSKINTEMIKNANLIRDYQKKLFECIEAGNKRLEEVIHEIEKDVNNESIKNKLEINSVFTLIKNCSKSLVNTKNQLGTILSAMSVLSSGVYDYTKGFIETAEKFKTIDKDIVYQNFFIKVFNPTQDVIMTDYIGKPGAENTFTQFDTITVKGNKYVVFFNSSKSNKENVEAVDKFKRLWESKE